MTTATSQDTITLNYNLYDLPTAQHKAGLAGLLFLIRTLQQRQVSPLPEILSETPVSLSLKLNIDSFQTLFKEVYAACLVESTAKQLRKDKQKQVIEPLRIEEKLSLKTNKNENIYIYHDVRPKGGVFSSYLPGGESSSWLKLWQDMLWGTLRGIPATRGIYEEQLESQSCSEANKIWAQLLKSQTPKHSQLTGPVASSVYVGAQDVNAEQVPFQGLVAQNLLLHFWTLVAFVYVPQRFKVEHKQLKSEYAGYVLAIPEVAHLQDFLDVYIPLLQNLNEEKLGFRPKDALMAIPEEAGMDYLFHLAQSGFLESKGKRLKHLIHSVELHHLEKPGNSLKILSTNKIAPQGRWFREYENLRQWLRNPLFKIQCLKNLLHNTPWYQGMDMLFSLYPSELFCYKRTQPQYAFFGWDAKRRFKILIDELSKKEAYDQTMVDLAEDQLCRSVYRLLRHYAQLKSESKSGRRYEDFKHQIKEKGYPTDYYDAREKVCRDAFLAIRGRREADFVEYFTGTICSVPHYLPEEEFIRVSQALLHDWETVKTLSLLALSAHSYLGSPKKETEGENV